MLEAVCVCVFLSGSSDSVFLKYELTQTHACYKGMEKQTISELLFYSVSRFDVTSFTTEPVTRENVTHTCMFTHDAESVQDTRNTYFYRWGEDTARSDSPGRNFHCSPLYPPCRRRREERWRQMVL